MKLLLRFLTVILFTIQSLAQANDQQESSYLRVKSGEDTTTYEFHSIRDFENNSDSILDEITTLHQTNRKDKTDKLTIEISITISSDKESTTLTGSITASYSTIINEAKKLRTQLIAMAMG